MVMEMTTRFLSIGILLIFTIALSLAHLFFLDCLHTHKRQTSIQVNTRHAFYLVYDASFQVTFSITQNLLMTLMGPMKNSKKIPIFIVNEKMCIFESIHFSFQNTRPTDMPTENNILDVLNFIYVHTNIFDGTVHHFVHHYYLSFWLREHFKQINGPWINQQSMFWRNKIFLIFRE